MKSHVRSSKTLEINIDGHSALISTLLLQKLPNDIILIVNRNIKETWDLTKILELVNQELGAREACIALKRSQDGKNGFENTEGLQYTGSSLHLGTRSSHQSKVKCVFCRTSHFSDKCSVISDCEARKKFLTENKKCFLCLGSGHVSRNCVKKKTYYYCKGMHNSAICYNKNKSTKTEEKEKIRQKLKLIKLKQRQIVHQVFLRFYFKLQKL